MCESIWAAGAGPHNVKAYEQLNEILEIKPK